MIAIDHFHIAKQLTNALNEIRKDEVKLIPSLNKIHFHKTRYHWLRNRHNLTESLHTELENQKAILQKTSIAWMLKEKARDIWHGIEPPTLTSWNQWLRIVKDSGLKPLQTMGEMIKKHLKGILNAMKVKVSNAKSEAINKNIKNLKRQAHGFKNMERFKSLIMLRYGRLETGFSH